MTLIRFLAILLTPLFLLGCFQSETIVHVKPDGSGIIEETSLFSRFAVESMQKMGKDLHQAMEDPKAENKTEEKDPQQEMIREAPAKAGQYGAGVKFISAVPVSTDSLVGYKALYAFEDINALQINQKPENKAGTLEEKAPGNGKAEIIRFKLVKGPVTSLTVILPDPKDEKEVHKDKEKDQAPKTADPQAAEMMKTLFKDMSIKVALKIEGTIIKTNATHLNKKELTLFEINFGKLMENPKVLEKLSSNQPKTIEEMKQIAKGIEGLKVEMNNPVWVDFK
jgi:hypothetical protein